MTTNKLVVTSATGTVGTEVVKQLAALDTTAVVALTHRNGNLAKPQKLPTGISSIAVDYNEPADIMDALEGTAKLVLITPNAPTQVNWARTIIEAARAHAVEQIVVLSSYNVESEPPGTIARRLAEQEHLVEASGISYTFLRAGHFMQNLINYYPPQPDGNFYLPLGDGKMNFVDVRDIARVTVLALTQPGHDNQIYRLATVNHTLSEVARILSQVTGRSFGYVDVPPEAVQTSMEQYGIPAWMIAENLELFAAVKAGLAAKTSADFETLTGQQPIDLATFFADHRTAFDNP